MGGKLVPSPCGQPAQLPDLTCWCPVSSQGSWGYVVEGPQRSARPWLTWWCVAVCLMLRVLCVCALGFRYLAHLEPHG